MFIGLYVVLALFAALPAGVAIFNFAPSIWSSRKGKFRDGLVDGKLPAFEASEVWVWSGMILVSFSAVLFVQYCYRLCKRDGLLPGRSLWTWSTIHMLLFLWWLPSSAARLIAMCPLWTAYFIMAVMAWNATNPPRRNLSNHPPSS